MSDGEKKFKAFLSMLLVFMVLPLICTIFRIDTNSVPRIIIILCWLGSAQVIARFLGVY